MKKIILILTFFGVAFAAKSQTIDSTSAPIFKLVTVVKIQPVKAYFQDGLSSSRLAIVVSNDDLRTQCDFYWTTYDNLGNRTATGNFHISGTTYTNFNHTFNQVYAQAPAKLGITYQ